MNVIKEDFDYRFLNETEVIVFVLRAELFAGSERFQCIAVKSDER